MEVYCLNIKGISKVMYQEVLRGIVTRERCLKADQFHYIKDAIRCVCGEALLRYCYYRINEYCGSINLKYNNYGKPFIANKEEFHYNISHSGDWVVIGYGINEVGIDIERIQDGVEGIANYCFSEAEKAYINEGVKENHARKVIQLWTLKESYIKYLGLGLSRELKKITIIPYTSEVIENNQKVKNVFAHSYEIDESYILATCGQDKKATIHRININEIIKSMNQIHDGL